MLRSCFPVMSDPQRRNWYNSVRQFLCYIYHAGPPSHDTVARYHDSSPLTLRSNCRSLSNYSGEYRRPTSIDDACTYSLTCTLIMQSDLEKSPRSLQSESQSDLENTPTSELKDPLPESKPRSTWQRLISALKDSGETRGIEPVPLEERQPVTASTSLHMMIMWFAMSLATNNIIVGSMGTFVLGLSFKDTALCAVFGNLLGVCAVGYVSTWGPISGNRTLVNLLSRQ